MAWSCSAAARFSLALFSAPSPRSSSTRKFRHAAVYAFAGAILSYFGFIHGAQLGIGASPQVALGYLLLGLICLVCEWRNVTATKPVAIRQPAE